MKHRILGHNHIVFAVSHCQIRTRKTSLFSPSASVKPYPPPTKPPLLSLFSFLSMLNQIDVVPFIMFLCCWTPVFSCLFAEENNSGKDGWHWIVGLDTVLDKRGWCDFFFLYSGKCYYIKHPVMKITLIFIMRRLHCFWCSWFKWTRISWVGVFVGFDLIDPMLFLVSLWSMDNTELKNI